MHLSNDELLRYAHRETTDAEDHNFTTHLTCCESCKDGLLHTELLAGLTDTADASVAPRTGERRRHARIPLHERAVLTRLNPLLAGRFPVHILNISIGGLKVHVPEALEPGTIVQLRLRAAVLTAEVRYCIPAGSHFHAGLRTTDVFRMEHERWFPARTARDHSATERHDVEP